jgi:hypothetical protein
MLRFLQEELPKLWTDELYSEQFRKSPSSYKDFQHALNHIVKATGRLIEMVELADHGHASDTFPCADLKKYLADLVICALRAAVKAPEGAIDLEAAVFDRIEQKMGVRLDAKVEGRCKHDEEAEERKRNDSGYH